MNERIEQLAEQAGAKIHKEQTRSGDWVDFSNYAGFDHEKFAELIVRECIKAVKPDTEYSMESVDVVEEFHRGYWVGCNDSTMRIKDYFGVEE